MIRFALKCAEGHSFDSWFQSGDAYEALAEKGLVTCAICGGTEVTKAIMAPRVAGGDIVEVPEAPNTPLQSPPHPAEEALRAMREHVEKTSTYVGGNFAREARAQHVGDVPEKPIHGEANAKEARALIEDGVPILPLPGTIGRKSN